MSQLFCLIKNPTHHAAEPAQPSTLPRSRIPPYSHLLSGSVRQAGAFTASGGHVQNTGGHRDPPEQSQSVVGLETALTDGPRFPRQQSRSYASTATLRHHAGSPATAAFTPSV